LPSDGYHYRLDVARVRSETWALRRTEETVHAALSVFESSAADYRSTLKALEFLEAGLPLT
jgi:hypothetical protein